MTKKAWIYCRQKGPFQATGIEITRNYLQKRCAELGYEVVGSACAQTGGGEAKKAFMDMLEDISLTWKDVDIIIAKPSVISHSTSDAVEICDLADSLGIKIYAAIGAELIDCSEQLSAAKIYDAMYTPVTDMTLQN